MGIAIHCGDKGPEAIQILYFLYMCRMPCVKIKYGRVWRTENESELVEVRGIEVDLETGSDAVRLLSAQDVAIIQLKLSKVEGNDEADAAAHAEPVDETLCDVSRAIADSARGKPRVPTVALDQRDRNALVRLH